MKYKTKQTQARLNEYACCYVFMIDSIIIILESNSCVFILTWWESAFQDLIVYQMNDMCEIKTDIC
jgi:hypothetical protein